MEAAGSLREEVVSLVDMILSNCRLDYYTCGYILYFLPRTLLSDQGGRRSRGRRRQGKGKRGETVECAWNGMEILDSHPGCRGIIFENCFI